MFVSTPTQRDTADAAAMFEVPAQRWVNLSDGTTGFALLNDCKYGYDARDRVLRLTLINIPAIIAAR
ncbi:glycoside hydrolase family 38 C-terminal domain-containing protein [Litorivicinus lipolyticus]|uniref:glycoside hydrolase family 38 C-terminal domain-containing protein n=1 Tax=Litorivicinus lipolyticus TaxID=418701 RepID=UPI001B865D3C|nr:glycoside hydrolase family 38 C-terminal domain-containing protein [Litorivicinus lipolyticus]